jgi:hypothetical protein
MAQIVVVLKSGERVPVSPENDPLYEWSTSDSGSILSVFRVMNGRQPEVIRQFTSDDVDHVEGD